jgi:multicomponent Na+:H+ antiporter subunit E
MTTLLRPWYALRLFVAFFSDLCISSVQVARTVLSPTARVHPRFVTIPLARAATPLEITLVANYITLTPGTLTVDAEAESRTLLVHSLLAGESSDAVRADVHDGIEPRVLRVTRS